MGTQGLTFSYQPRSRRPEAERFWEKVVGADACWEWTGAKTQNGYGQFRLEGRHGRLVLAHRWSYETLVGPIPYGLDLDHLCRNRGCVNPEHLEAVTRVENLRRGLAGMRVSCPQGHLYSPENTWMSKAGARGCRTCNRERQRELRQLKGPRVA